MLSYIRKLPPDARYIQEEIALLKTVIEEERRIAGDQSGVWAYLRGAVRELQIPSMRFRFVVEFIIFILMNFSGAVVINYYSPQLLGAIGLKGTTSCFTPVSTASSRQSGQSRSASGSWIEWEGESRG